MKLLTLINNIKQKLFNKLFQKQESAKPTLVKEDSIPQSDEAIFAPLPPEEKEPAVLFPDSISEIPKKRQPYFIQIGFDFGTCYSKCICRDIITNMAWIHINSGYQDKELPFLMPCAMTLEDGMIGNVQAPESHYPQNGLYHVKQALAKIALHQWNDQVLNPYQKAIKTQDPEKLSRFVEDCAVFYLSRALGEVRASIRQRMPDFGAISDDYMAVNLAVPISEAENEEVNNFYSKILSEAWILSDTLFGYPKININELALLRKENSKHCDIGIDKACFIYPEVSANVQGFVRSRVSRPGMYLFSDTGAATVDQGVFIFARDNHIEELVYLTGRVLPLGSSIIELRAANNCGNMDPDSLERLRDMKERGESRQELTEAKGWIENKLSEETRSTLAFAKQKLFVREQINEMRIIFGGGGHCDYPYKTAVIKPYSGDLFRQTVVPDIVGLPVPNDLEIDEHESRWLKRLSVAYGLSFEKSELAGFTYPRNVAIPEPEEIWQPRRIIPDAPTNDEC